MTQTQVTEQTAPSQLLESLSANLVPELKRYLKHHLAASRWSRSLASSRLASRLFSSSTLSCT